MKTCSKCKLEKSHSEFSIRSGAKDGLQGYCKECQLLSNSERGLKRRGLKFDGALEQLCRTCGLSKSPSEFCKCSQGKFGRHSMCKKCQAKRASQYRQDQIAKNPDWDRESHYKKDYGLTLNQYNELCLAQNDQCAICGTNTPGGRGRFHVDHDHATGLVRKLLCHHYNVGLGHFKDDPALLEAAAAYLRSYQSQRVA